MTGMAVLRAMLALAAIPAAVSFVPSMLSGTGPALRQMSTCGVVPARRAVSPLRCAKGDVASPFKEGSEAGNAAAQSSGNEETPLTIEAVDKVLDQVRPYLIADGGNCKVVDVDSATGDVSLMLEGACGTCPSSTVTLKMGIERALREEYGARLGQVIPLQGAAQDALSVETCNALIEPVKAAVVGLGGTMKVLAVDDVSGAVTVQYSGPEKLTYGIELTLLDHPAINKVEFVAP